MRYVVEIDERAVWRPAQRLGALFHEYALALEDLIGVPAGITPFAPGYLILDRVAHAHFVQELHRWSGSSGHPLAAELSEPVLAISLVLLERAGVVLPLDHGPAPGVARSAAAIPGGAPGETGSLPVLMPR